jgi:DNA repair protein RadD
MAALELRPLQESAYVKVSEAWRAGHRNIMLYAPCGWGKSIFAVAALKAVKERGKRASLLLDRVSLVDQMSTQLDKYDLAHGVMQSQHWRYRPSESIQVCSVQTLARRKWPENQALIIVDEAHILMQSVRDKLDRREGYALGLSASPVTPGLGNHFDIVINAATPNQLIELGLLVPLEVYECTAPDMTGVPVMAGEWKESETEKKSLAVIGEVVQDYIGFGVNIRHVRELQRQFIMAGINVACYTADDSDEEKEEIMREFRKPDSLIRGLLSVDALTRGVDIPDIGLLIMARPLRKAWHIVVQMIGRVQRTAEGKMRARIHCHSGNMRRFHNELKEIFENGVTYLDGHERPEKSEEEKAKEEKKVEPVKCPQCKCLHDPRPSCPKCGFEYPEKSSGVQHIPGTLREMREFGNAKVMQEQCWPQVVDYVLNMKVAKGKDQDWIEKKARSVYFGLTNRYPSDKVKNTAPIACSSSVSGMIKHNLMKYVKSAKYKGTK